MPIAFVKKSARTKLGSDAVDWANSQGLPEEKIEAMVAEIQDGMECYVPDGAFPAMLPWKLSCGLAFVVPQCDLCVDTTRGLVAPAGVPASVTDLTGLINSLNGRR